MKLPTKTRNSRIVTIGNLKIGSRNKIAIQTMLKEPIQKVKENINKINKLEEIGCDLVRFAIRNSEEIKYIKEIKKNTNIPLVADIQFDYKHALSAIIYGFDGIRINPGYVNDKRVISEILNAAKDYGTAIRVGFNSGSLTDKVNIGNFIKKTLFQIEEHDFKNYKVSFKSSSVEETIHYNKLLIKLTNAPIHLGVTEAGPLITSVVRSTLAFKELLNEGIGDTIRVSLTGDPLEEVIIAKEILRELGLYDKGVEIVSCPTCSRTHVSSKKMQCLVEEIAKGTTSLKKNIKLAIMGCQVNGPGEARGADIALVNLYKNKFQLYKNGNKVKIVDYKNIIGEIHSYAK